MVSFASLPPWGRIRIIDLARIGWPVTEKQISGGAIRRIVLEQSKRANVGHIGSALSVADILAALYGGVLVTPGPSDAGRDRFILSKGHAALALYAALNLAGWLSDSELNTFCGDLSRAGVHPQHSLTGVDFTTGSLGMGLSVAAGVALAARMDGSARRAFALLSDAECNEGAIWEAAMFAAHHKLAGLTAIIDLNGQQAFGYTRDVLDLGSMAEKWRAFGWDVHEVDGHDEAALKACLHSLDHRDGAPHMLIARTVFAKGVSFMEGLLKWHYSPMSDEEFRAALAEVRGEI
jgi:transketolase